jgi:hypothetical protein
LAIPVLLILAVLWAAVLIPPVLRSRHAGQGSSIGDYTQRLGVLGNPSAGRSGPRRHLHVVPPAHPGVHRAPSPARSASARAATLQRRRQVLFVLAGAVGATLLLFVVVRSPMVLVLQVLADAAFGAYIYLLIQFTHRPMRASAYATGPTAMSSRTTLSIRHPDPPARPELAPVPEFALYRTASSR